ncbi:MAG: hypothetical protein ACRBCS_07505 [Cellvibrionaceae bacterium]
MVYFIRFSALMGMISPLLFFVLVLLAIFPAAILSVLFASDSLKVGWNSDRYTIYAVLNFFVYVWVLASYTLCTAYIVHRSFRVLVGRKWYLEIAENKKRYLPPLGKYLTGTVIYIFLVTVFLYFKA